MAQQSRSNRYACVASFGIHLWKFVAHFAPAAVGVIVGEAVLLLVQASLPRCRRGCADISAPLHRADVTVVLGRAAARGSVVVQFQAEHVG